MSNNIMLKNSPDNDAMWRGLGGNFDNITQIINEFVDNSISNYLGKSSKLTGMHIVINFYEKSENTYTIQIKDNGTGIKDLNSAFSIGSQGAKDSPLNEHGYGMKHALAAANLNNDNWAIVTSQNDKFYLIKAPFNMNNQIVQETSNLSDFNISIKNIEYDFSHGTIVQFDISKNLMKTVSRGLSGNYRKLSSMVDLLREDLGYTYGPILSKSNNAISIFLVIYDEEGNKLDEYSVSELKVPDHMLIQPKSGRIPFPDTETEENKKNVEKADVKLNYEFMEIIPGSKKYNKKHYLANMSTSGVEIRINGRLMADNIFSEIWKIEKHNSYNNLLIRINIESNDTSKLPKTSTTKTNILQDDKYLIRLNQWIKNKLPSPAISKESSTEEVDNFKKLKKRLMSAFKSIDDSAIVTTEEFAFTSLGEKIRIDLYSSVNSTVNIYEGKLPKPKPLDVYQLVMYWDGLVYDGSNVNKATLVVSSIPKTIKDIVKLQNSKIDENGDNYNIILKTWDEVLTE